MKKEEQKYPVSDEALKYSSLLYYGPEAESVPAPKNGFVEVGEKYDAFVKKYIRGKKTEKVLLAGYILYRQATWIYNTWLMETARTTHDQEKINSFSKSFFGEMLSVTGMNSRMLETADVMVRTAFCGTRLWGDMSDWIKAFRQPMLWADDPDRLFEDFYWKWRSAYKYFSNPFYYGRQLSLVKRVVLGLSLPLAWSSVFSIKSPGNPLGNPMFRTAAQNALAAVVYEGGDEVERAFERKLTPKKRSRIFHKTGGIVRERFFTDIARWYIRYAQRRYIYRVKQQDLAPHMARCAGKYIIRHLYMQGAVELLKVFCRNGGIQTTGWIGDKIGWVLSKAGFFRRNPKDQTHDFLKKLCMEHEILREDQDLNEVLVYPAVVFPGAFARAVQQVVSKQMLPLIEQDAPQFVEYLNAMNDISPYDLLHAWPYNPMIIHTMWSSIDGVRKALPAHIWKKVLAKFLNEMIIDAFLNRERLVCQYFTESIIGYFSKPILKKLNHTFLPRKAK